MTTGAVRLRERRVYLAGVFPVPYASRRLRPGQRLTFVLPTYLKAPRISLNGRRAADAPAASAANPVIVYADEHIVVVDKPPGLTTMRHAEDAAEHGSGAERYLPSTLADLLPRLLAKRKHGRPGPVRAVHRIDNGTSGLVVFVRTVEAERHLGGQFRRTPRIGFIWLWFAASATVVLNRCWCATAATGRRGSTLDAADGQRAVTHVRMVEEFAEYTLVECQLETGRTHQVRIHLGEADAFVRRTIV